MPEGSEPVAAAAETPTTDTPHTATTILAVTVLARRALLNTRLSLEGVAETE
jgi:hypothetical protein